MKTKAEYLKSWSAILNELRAKVDLMAAKMEKASMPPAIPTKQAMKLHIRFGMR